ncbi:MAG: PKD domain-containing protein, partial [Thermoplasmata archaeon]
MNPTKSGAAHAHPRRRFRGRWGVTPMMAAATLVVVVVLVGAGSYALFERVGPSNVKVSRCFPPGSAGCSTAGTHGLSVLAPFATAQSGLSIPFTVLLPPGAVATSYDFNFGDGTPWVGSTQSTVDHAYADPGSYLVQVNATIGGIVEDNLHDLASIKIDSGLQSAASGNGQAPIVSGEILANSSTAVAPSGVLRAGQSLTVEGSYLAHPTNPDFLEQPPRVEVTSGGGSPAVTVASNET